MRSAAGQIQQMSRPQYVRGVSGGDFHAALDALDRDFPGDMMRGHRLARHQDQPHDLQVFRFEERNRLRLRKNKLEAHLVKEIREVRELTRSLKGTADKSVIDALHNEAKSVYEQISGGLKELIQEFGVE